MITNGIVRFGLKCVMIVAFGFVSQSTVRSQSLPSDRVISDVAFAVRVADKLIVEDASSHTSEVEELAKLASSRSSLANLMHFEHSIQDRAGQRCWTSKSNVVDSIAKALECRQRQTAQSNARKLHYGIATSLEGVQLSNRAIEQNREFLAIQVRLIQEGIPIPDPTLIDRSKLRIEDEKTNLESKVKQLRIQLSLLVGSDVACTYSPKYDSAIDPSDCDVCEYVSFATCNRCDIAVLRRLLLCLDESDLDEWDRVAGHSLGLPMGNSVSNTPWKKLKACFSLKSRQSELASRRRWIESLITQLSNQITVDVEVAYEQKKTAALRWVNAIAVREAWSGRIEMLKKLEALRGTLSDQLESSAERDRAESIVIQRWYEWHEADANLKLAVGCE